jgi:hypothetical protein
MAQASALAGRPWLQVDSRIGVVPTLFLMEGWVLPRTAIPGKIRAEPSKDCLINFLL